MSRLNRQLFLHTTNGLHSRSRTLVVDNSGARFFMITTVYHSTGVYKRYPRGGIGSFVQGVVTKGRYKGTLMRAMIVKQRAPFRIRGRWAQGTENQVVLFNQEGKPLGTKVSSAMLPEVKFFNANIGQILRRLY